MDSTYVCTYTVYITYIKYIYIIKIRKLRKNREILAVWEGGEEWYNNINTIQTYEIRKMN